MAKENLDKTISIRLSSKMLEELDLLAQMDEKDRAELIREAISQLCDSNGERKGNQKLEERLEEVNKSYKWQEKEIKRLNRRCDEMNRLLAYCLENLPKQRI